MSNGKLRIKYTVVFLKFFLFGEREREPSDVYVQKGYREVVL